MPENPSNGNGLLFAIQEIFDYWKLVMNHPRARLDAGRDKAIRGMLRVGYSVDDCRMAIEGCAASDFHQGVNDRSGVYDSVGLIFRNADKFDKFMDLGEQLRRRVSANLQRESAPAAERKPMPENVKQRVYAILKGRLAVSNPSSGVH